MNTNLQNINKVRKDLQKIISTVWEKQNICVTNTNIKRSVAMINLTSNDVVYKKVKVM